MKHNEINNILYNTLKDILKLQSGCQKFVLEVDIHSFPVVTQLHLIGNDTETLTQEEIKMGDDGYSLKIEGFKTKKQVEEFIKWYSGSGEQSSATWFECRVADGKLDVDFMPVDCERTFPVKFDANEGKMFLKVD